jgi:sulfur carrier protein
LRYWKNGSVIIKVNGENLEIDNQSTAAALIVQLGYQDQRIALEINEAIISKSKHVEFTLNEGDQVEIIKAVGGG